MPSKQQKRQIQKELPLGIINPFSSDFLEYWYKWKIYKLEEFGFTYKGCISEQAALMKLNDLSGGNEEMAWKIIKQSMEGPWRGLFPLRENNNQNGKSVTETRKDVGDILGARPY